MTDKAELRFLVTDWDLVEIDRDQSKGLRVDFYGFHVDDKKSILGEGRLPIIGRSIQALRFFDQEANVLTDEGRQIEVRGPLMLIDTISSVFYLILQDEALDKINQERVDKYDLKVMQWEDLYDDLTTLWHEETDYLFSSSHPQEWDSDL